MSKFLLVILIASTTNILGATNNGCIIPFGSKALWDIFWPLIFNANGTLYKTLELNSVESVQIQNDEIILASCGPNYIKKDNSRKQFISAKCENGGKFRIENDKKLRKSKDFACDLRNIEEIVKPVNSCPKDSTSVRFGFVHPLEQLSYITGEACYNPAKGQTYFIHLRKGDINESAIEVTNTKYFNGEHPQLGYKSAFMRAFRLDEFNNRLKTTLNTDIIPQYKIGKYIDNNLLSNSQFLQTTKLSWNYYAQSDDISNLDLLRQDIENLKEPIDIYTGSYGVIKLNDINDTEISIYLNEKRFPVPEIIWTIINNKNKATVFIVFNKPNVLDEEIKKYSENCQTMCERIKWLNNLSKKEKYLNRQNGLVLCCSYENISKIIEPIPSLENIDQLF